MNVILVLAADTMLARVICRALHRRGFEVLVAAAAEWPICAYSRYVRRTFVHADPTRDEDGFIDDLRRICEENRVSVLLPVLGEAAVIARHRHRLGSDVRLLLGDADTLAIFADKYRTYGVAREAGVLVPEYRAVADLADDPAALAAFPCPCLAKPVWGWGGYGMHECDDAQALAALIADMPEQTRADYFVQRRMAGDVVCVAMLCDAGRVYASDTFRIVTSYPSRHGQSTVRETVRCDAAVESLRGLLEHVRWSGPCQADFIVDPATGAPYLIDINARYWNSLIQSTARGIDFPSLHCMLALGEECADVEPTAVGVTTAWLSRALRGDPALVLRRMFARGGGLAGRGIAACDDWDAHDPLPFFVWPVRHVLRNIMVRLTAWRGNAA